MLFCLSFVLINDSNYLLDDLALRQTGDDPTSHVFFVHSIWLAWPDSFSPLKGSMQFASSSLQLQHFRASAMQMRKCVISVTLSTIFSLRTLKCRNEWKTDFIITLMHIESYACDGNSESISFSEIRVKPHKNT